MVAGSSVPVGSPPDDYFKNMYHFKRLALSLSQSALLAGLLLILPAAASAQQATTVTGLVATANSYPEWVSQSSIPLPDALVGKVDSLIDYLLIEGASAGLMTTDRRFWLLAGDLQAKETGFQLPTNCVRGGAELLFVGGAQPDGHQRYLLRDGRSGELFSMPRTTASLAAALVSVTAPLITAAEYPELKSALITSDANSDLVAVAADRRRIAVAPAVGDGFGDFQNWLTLDTPVAQFSVGELSGDQQHDLALLAADGSVLVFAVSNAVDRFELKTAALPIAGAAADYSQLAAIRRLNGGDHIVLVHKPSRSLFLAHLKDGRIAFSAPLVVSQDASEFSFHAPSNYYLFEQLLLLETNGSPRLMAIRSTDDGTLEVYPLTLEGVKYPLQGLVFGDFCDVDEDLDIVLLDAANRLVRSCSTLFLGMPDVRIVSSSGTQTYTGPVGHFTIIEPGAPPFDLTAHLVGYRFTPERRRIADTSNQPWRKFTTRSKYRPPMIGNDPGIHSPQVCNGYDAPIGQWHNFDRTCSPGSAYYFSGEGSGDDIGPCCPLPAADILVSQRDALLGRRSPEPAELIAEESCPPDFVVTAMAKPEERLGLRCSRINTERYQLGPERPMAYAGFGASSLKEVKIVRKELIPSAIRGGFGRLRQNEWSADGCIGDPPGSLLTAKRGQACFQQAARQLQYRGLPGDPPQGTAVVMFPDCEVSDRFSPFPDCRK